VFVQGTEALGEAGAMAHAMATCPPARGLVQEVPADERAHRSRLSKQERVQLREAPSSAVPLRSGVLGDGRQALLTWRERDVGVGESMAFVVEEGCGALVEAEG